MFWTRFVDGMRPRFERPRVQFDAQVKPTFVDVAGVCLLPGLATLLLLARRSGGSLLACFLLVGWSLASWGLATSGGLLFSGFRRHF
jgi:hypothetical protein